MPLIDNLTTKEEALCVAFFKKSNCSAETIVFMGGWSGCERLRFPDRLHSQTEIAGVSGMNFAAFIGLDRARL